MVLALNKCHSKVTYRTIPLEKKIQDFLAFCVLPHFFSLWMQPTSLFNVFITRKQWEEYSGSEQAEYFTISICVLD